MKLVARSVTIDRRPSEVFALVDDPEHYEDFFVGVTRWESRSERRTGVGARYRVLMRVGSIEAGGTIRVTDHRAGELIAWTWEEGIHQEGRWELTPRDGGTELTLEVGFDLSGGPAGRLVERLAGRIVGRNLTATLLAARRILEARARV